MRALFSNLRTYLNKKKTNAIIKQELFPTTVTNFNVKLFWYPFSLSYLSAWQFYRKSWTPFVINLNKGYYITVDWIKGFKFTNNSSKEMRIYLILNVIIQNEIINKTYSIAFHVYIITLQPILYFSN